MAANENLDFAGFSPEDFDAYLPEKWNSNMFTLERRKVKGKLETIGESLANELESQGLALVMHMSDEFPSLWNKKSVDTQWLFFSRNEAAKAELTDIIDKERTLANTLADPTPRYRQLFLGMALNQDHLEIGLRLHQDAWVDRNNLLNLLEKAEERARFATLLAEIPNHYELELAGQEPTSPSGYSEPAIDELAVAFRDGAEWLFIGARMPRDQVPVLGEEVLETACDIFRKLVPVYRFVAWSPNNDAVSMDQLLKERDEHLRASREELDRERAEREARRREKEVQGAALKEEIAEKVRETQAWRAREMAARRIAAAKMASQAKEAEARQKAEEMAAKLGLGDAIQPPKEDGQKQEPTDTPFSTSFSKGADGKKQTSNTHHTPKRTKRESRAPQSGHKNREIPSSMAVKERPGEIQVGDLVKVKRGFLKGRRGTVQEIGERGMLKIGFGPLSSRIDVADVVGLEMISADYSRSTKSSGRGEKGNNPR